MKQMKFYSYANRNNNYTKAISLEGIRSLCLCEGTGKSAIRFSVWVQYTDGRNEQFNCLQDDEAKQVYKSILDLLNA